MSSWLSQYLVAALLFAALDAIWLTTVAKRLYEAKVGDLLADSPNMIAAVAFYVIFLVGLVYFVIHPAIESGSWMRALLTGALFGLVTYATFGLTNLAVFEAFTPGVVIPDLAWGAVVSATVATGTYAIVQALPSWAGGG